MIMIMLYFVQIYFCSSAVLVSKLFCRFFHFVNSRSPLARARKRESMSVMSQMLYRIFGFNSVLWTCSMTQMDILLLEEGKMIFCSVELPV